uniref:Reverse transcriptase Ty1/copia-type domain-containing protein n=1 Tax=Fagus sylvatica TaxID=28930 RepID=A0A2N9GSL0_FAGSY
MSALDLLTVDFDQGVDRVDFFQPSEMKKLVKGSSDDDVFRIRLIEWDSNNHQILTRLRNISIPSISNLLGNFDDARTAWDMLAIRYSSPHGTREYQLSIEQYQIRQNPGQSINDFYAYAALDELVHKETRLQTLQVQNKLNVLATTSPLAPLQQSKSDQSSPNTRRSRQKSNKFCLYCKKHGHTIEICYRHNRNTAAVTHFDTDQTPTAAVALEHSGSNHHTHHISIREHHLSGFRPGWILGRGSNLGPAIELDSSDHSSGSSSDKTPHSSSESPAPAPFEDPTPATTFRCSFRVTSLSSHLRDFHCYTALATLHESHSYREAPSNPLWQVAMTKELDALFKNRIWDLVDLPPDKSVVGCKWVFKIKTQSNGSIERYKAHFVAKGFTQEYGIDFEETFVPIARLSSICTLLAVAASLQLYSFSTGFFHKFYDSAFFLRRIGKGTILLLLYVDDMIITGDDLSMIQELKDFLSQNFEMKDLGHLNYFLGLEITSSDDGFYFTQAKYTFDLLSRAGLMDHKIVDTPIELNARLIPSSGELLPDPTLY